MLPSLKIQNNYYFMYLNMLHEFLAIGRHFFNLTRCKIKLLPMKSLIQYSTENKSNPIKTKLFLPKFLVRKAGEQEPRKKKLKGK